MESWAEGFEESGATFHEVYTEATDCATRCHSTDAGAAAPDLIDVRDFHDGLETERVGIIYGGEDQSVKQGKDFTEWKITQVVDNKTTSKLEVPGRRSTRAWRLILATRSCPRRRPCSST